MRSWVRQFLFFLLSISWGAGGICFAYNAAYIDLQVSFPSGKNYVSLYRGSAGAIDDDMNDYYVNVHLTLLDEDGLPATAGPDGEDLDTLEATLETTLGKSGSIVGDEFLSDSETLHFDLETEVGPAARANVRYACTSYCSVGNDTIEVVVGDLSDSVEVEVKAPDADDIVIRLCGNDGCEVDELFEPDPGQQKNGGAAAEAGSMISFEVLALEENGSFTFAPNLQGKELTVSAYADYDADGKAEGSVSYEATPIAAATATFSNGKATGEIEITEAGTLDKDGNARMNVVFTATTGVTNASGETIETKQVSTVPLEYLTTDTETDYVAMYSDTADKLIIGRDPLDTGNLVEEIDYWYVLDDETRYGGPWTNQMAVFVADSYGNPVTGETVDVTSSIDSDLLDVGVTDEQSGWDISKSVRSNDDHDGLAVALNNVRNEHVPKGVVPVQGEITLDGVVSGSELDLTEDTATVYLMRTDLRPYDPAYPHTGANYLDLHMDTDYAGTNLTAGSKITVYITDVNGSAGSPTSQDIIEVGDEVTLYAHSVKTSNGWWVPDTSLKVSGDSQSYSDAVTDGYSHTITSSEVGETYGEIRIPIKIWGECTQDDQETVVVSLTASGKGIGCFKDPFLWKDPPLSATGGLLYGLAAPQYDLTHRWITDLKPAGETKVKVSVLASGVVAKDDDLDADPIIITSEFVVGGNSFLTPDSIDTSDDYGNVYNDTPSYSLSQTIGVATTDATRGCTLTFDEDDIGQTGTVTVTVSGIGSQVFNILHVVSATSLVLEKEGPALTIVGGEAIVKLTANGNTSSDRQVLISIDTDNSVADAELRELDGTILGTSYSGTLGAGSPSTKWLRLVVSASEVGSVLIYAEDTETSPLNGASLTINFESQDTEDPTADISPADGSTAQTTAEIVITVEDNRGVDLGDTVYLIEKDGSDVTSDLACETEGDKSTQGTITCSKDGGGLDVGKYEVSVTPEDLAGNVGAEESSAFTVMICMPAVQINPTAKTVRPGESVGFSASTTCNGSTLDGEYNWKVDSTIGSTIDENGVYTAGEEEGRDTVTVTDTANGNITAAAEVVVCVPLVSISPNGATLKFGEAEAFTATTTCGGSTVSGTYNWYATGGNLDTTGGGTVVYTAGTTEGSYAVTVTDTPNSATASVTVVVESGLTIVPATVPRSRWIVLPVLMTIEGEGTSFAPFSIFNGEYSVVTFDPATSVLALPPLVLNAERIWQLILVMPSWLTGIWNESEIVTVTVTTGTEKVSGNLTIEMLPFLLDEQESLK